MNSFAARASRMQLWLLQNEGEEDAHHVENPAAMLTAEDLIEARSRPPGRRRRQFLSGRTLLRCALRAHFPRLSPVWKIDRNRHGRPYICAPELETPVYFSISHTDGLTACLVARTSDIAVDVERIAEHDDLALVAQENFSTLELEDLLQCKGWDWFTRFFDYWTLKEAYCKALGVGLRLRLADIEFEFDPAGRIRMLGAPGGQDNAKPWFFWTRHLSCNHVISIAARNELHEEPEISCWASHPQGGSHQSGGMRIAVPASRSNH